MEGGKQGSIHYIGVRFGGTVAHFFLGEEGHFPYAAIKPTRQRSMWGYRSGRSNIEMADLKSVRETA
jgi:hypothetical protein